MVGGIGIGTHRFEHSDDKVSLDPGLSQHLFTPLAMRRLYFELVVQEVFRHLRYVNAPANISIIVKMVRPSLPVAANWS